MTMSFKHEMLTCDINAFLFDSFSIRDDQMIDLRTSHIYVTVVVLHHFTHVNIP